MRKLWLPVVLSTALTFGALPALTAGPAAAAETGAVVSAAACTATDLSRNDDGSSPAVELPFEVDFYGQRYQQLWANNNGNISFDQPLSTYTPFGLDGTDRVIVAPLFADVDTRGAGSDVVRYGYGTTTFNGRPAFCVNWLDVGYYAAHFDKLNSFQLLLVDRSDRRAGDVDVATTASRGRPATHPAAWVGWEGLPPVALDGRASHDPDGEVVRYIWEFDDGTVLEGPVVTDEYTEPGEYLVTLTVVDDRYTCVWKTPDAWAGQCRDLQMTLDDGSSATVRFRFR